MSVTKHLFYTLKINPSIGLQVQIIRISLQFNTNLHKKFNKLVFVQRELQS